MRDDSAIWAECEARMDVSDVAVGFGVAGLVVGFAGLALAVVALVRFYRSGK